MTNWISPEQYKKAQRELNRFYSNFVELVVKRGRKMEHEFKTGDKVRIKGMKVKGEDVEGILQGQFGRDQMWAVYSESNKNTYMCHEYRLEPIEKGGAMEKFKAGDEVNVVMKEEYNSQENVWEQVCARATVRGLNMPDNMVVVELDHDKGRAMNVKIDKVSLVKQEKSMSKLLRPISMQAIILAGAAQDCEDFIEFGKKALDAGYGFDKEIPLEDAVAWAKTRFLWNEGFIKDVEEMKTYSFGDHFIDRLTGENWVIALLYKQERTVCAVNTDTGYTKPLIIVVDPEKITPEEFAHIKDTPNEWT